MALNRPSAAELLAALREFLDKDVAPQVSGATQFHLRVAGNVLAIVERELAQKAPADAAETARLRTMLGDDDSGAADLTSLNQLLVERIRSGAFDSPPGQRLMLAHLRATTSDKLAIDNPKYA